MPAITHTKLLVLTSLFTALTVIGAQLRVPLPLVPFSLQTFFVLLAGSVLGPKHGALSQLLYLALGLAGLPIFTKGGGPAYVLQPTFGYLLAFPLASFIAGKIIHRRSQHAIPMPAATWPRLALANSLATLTILTIGACYLWLNINWLVGRELAFAQALYTGAVIFLPADLIKISAATILYRALQKPVSLRLVQKAFSPALKSERTT